MTDERLEQRRAEAPIFSKLYIPWLLAGAVLLVPFVAMQFTREVAWSAGDFAVAALVLAAFVGTGQLLLWKLTTARARLLAVAGLIVLFFYVWVELAVGVFDIPGISGS